MEYIPKQGDIVFLSFDPQSGHEQKGRRPALVISKYLFNVNTGLAVVCPITNTNRNIPFHVPIPKDFTITGFIMVDQVKSIDYNSREIEFVKKITKSVLNEVLGILSAFIF
ncbi:MAG: type II toxin-antitoxin system PemK/MazF family toxin [Desulfobacterales bacterium]|nr:type II toxin-antitoxin system PemK/MazF family toxin [Desulfobacterales bacterium]